MAIEAIKGAGMSFQGSSTAARVESAPRVESASNATASDAIATKTVEISTKSTDADGGGNNGGTGYEQQMPTNEQLKRAVEEINKKANNSTAVFGVHEETNRITIKIINKESKEVIKEFPPEKTLDMIAKVWEMAGLMVDEKR